jgi:hypothetical protein
MRPRTVRGCRDAAHLRCLRVFVTRVMRRRARRASRRSLHVQGVRGGAERRRGCAGGSARRTRGRLRSPLSPRGCRGGSGGGARARGCRERGGGRRGRSGGARCGSTHRRRASSLRALRPRGASRRGRSGRSSGAGRRARRRRLRARGCGGAASARRHPGSRCEVLLRNRRPRLPHATRIAAADMRARAPAGRAGAPRGRGGRSGWCRRIRARWLQGEAPGGARRKRGAAQRRVHAPHAPHAHLPCSHLCCASILPCPCHHCS